MQNGRSRKSEVRNGKREDERIFNSVIARRLAKIIASASLGLKPMPSCQQLKI